MEHMHVSQAEEEPKRFSDLSIEELVELRDELSQINRGKQQDYYIRTVNRRIKELKG